MRYLAVVFIILNTISYAQPGESSKKEGYIKKTDENKKLLYEGMFRNNKPVGRFKYYYPHDTVRAIVDFNPNGKSAYATLFHMNGKKWVKENILTVR